ncbi:MAG: heme ABC transporter ATP-binding protein [Gammaproteobacteria bacterium]
MGLWRGARAVLCDVSLDVSRGELFAVLGCNGAGKSTLLQVLAGDLRPEQGEVRFDGRPLAHWERGTLARARAVLQQSTTVHLPFTVREVVELGLLPFGPRALSRHRDAIDAALACMGIDAAGDRPYHHLSGGEQQRVQFARCLVQVEGAGRERGVLMLDEPVAHLDPSYQHVLLATARDFTRRGGTVIVVLHDLNLALAYADRALLLHGGRVAACGTPREILTSALVSKVFGLPVIRIDPPALPHPLLAFTAQFPQDIMMRSTP